MSTHLQKQRMNTELIQIHSILDDFRKTLLKCLQLSKCINCEIPKQEYLKNVEKTTLRKMDLLDIAGLVYLKNQLVRTLTDLFEIERELRYKKEKYDARRQIMDCQLEEVQQVRKSQPQSTFQGSHTSQTIMIQKPRSIINEPKRQQPFQEPRTKSKNLQIPLYRAKNQTNENKLDRISKYIASLKRNMKLNSQTLGYRWKIKEFLLEDPNYVRLRTDLERYMMREEQLDNIQANAVEKGLREFICKSEIVESRDNYKLIKIYKQKPPQNNPDKQNILDNAQFQTQSNKIAKETFPQLIQSCKIREFQHQVSQIPYIDLSYRSPRLKKQPSVPDFVGATFNSPLRKLSTKIEIESKAQQDFNLIKRQLQKSNESYIEMLSKINQSVEKGSEKLIQLREKRKKKNQKDFDVWDELEKI